MSDFNHMQHEHDTSGTSSHAAASAAGVGSDTNHIPVTLTHLNQLYTQFSQLQQETMQNVHQIQVSLHDIQSQAHPHNTDTGSLPVSHIVPIPGQIKLPKPSLYTGAVRTNVETWLFEVEQYLAAYGCNIDSQRIAVATGSMKGLALQWWRSEYVANPGLVISWEEFKERVRRRFQPVAASRTARANLRSLKQGNKTVAEFCGLYYEQIQVINDMSEADKIENFMYGLQQGLYSEVDRRDPQTLQDAMTYAQRAELRNRVRAQYGANHLRNRFSYPTSTSTTHSPTTSTTPTTATIPMELGRVEVDEEREDMEEAYEQYLNEIDEEECLAELEELQLEEEAEVEQEEKKVEPTQLHAITTRNNNRNSRLTKEELIRLRREGRCFRCKRKDHISRDCPFANRPQRRNGGNQPQPSKY